jgi:hypothetical protein
MIKPKADRRGSALDDGGTIESCRSGCCDAISAPHGNAYTLSAPFDGWLRPNETKVAALPTAAKKLIVGNTFVGTSVVQWFGDTLYGVHADNTFRSCNARTGIGGLMIGGALQAGALCYKGAPGQIFFTEYLGNTLIDSDGIVLVSDCDHPSWAARDGGRTPLSIARN